MWTATASTMVFQPPTVAPSLFSTGRPSRSIAMSVVVPPMSETRMSSSPDRWRAPTRLAAGPERMVSTGQVSASSALISEPSPFTTISGALMPLRASSPSTAWISCCNCGMRRALSAAVSARRGASSLEVSSWPQVTGLPVSSRISRRTAISCAGLRTEK